MIHLLFKIETNFNFNFHISKIYTNTIQLRFLQYFQYIKMRTEYAKSKKGQIIGMEGLT